MAEQDGRKLRDNLTDKEKEKLKRSGSLNYTSAGATRKDNKEMKESKMAPNVNPCGMGYGQQDAENTSIKSFKKVENTSKGVSHDKDRPKARIFARVLSRVQKNMPVGESMHCTPQKAYLSTKNKKDQIGSNLHHNIKDKARGLHIGSPKTSKAPKGTPSPSESFHNSVVEAAANFISVQGNDKSYWTQNNRVDELSKGTIRSYREKSIRQTNAPHDKKTSKGIRKLVNRYAGQTLGGKKLVGAARVNAK